MNADQLDWLTERVLGAVFEVTNTLGAGFLEKPPASQLGCIPDPKTTCVPVRVKPPQRNFTQQLRRFHPFATVAKDPTAMPDFPSPT